MRTVSARQIVVIIAYALLVSEILTAQQSTRILVGPNVLVSRDRNGISDEPFVASDPKNSRNLLGSAIFFRTRHSIWDQEARGYYSRDGGYSWNTVIFPEAAANHSGDPVVAYGPSGTGYFVCGNRSDQGPALHFYRSEDGGVNWNKPAVLSYMDHQQITVDHTSGPFAGNIYISGLFHKQERGREESDYHIGIYRSRDDGRSWIGITDVANNHGLLARGLNAMNVALFSDGELFIPFVDFPANWGTEVNGGKFRYWFTASKDGGSTFSALRKFVFKDGSEISGPSNHFPFFAIDNSDGPFRDRVYMVWADSSPFPLKSRPIPQAVRLLISFSSDRGNTWAKPRYIEIMVDGSQPVGHQPLQSIAVNNEGTLVVSWYDARDTLPRNGAGAVNRYVAASVDGGETFHSQTRLSSRPTYKSSLWQNLIGAQANANSVTLISGAQTHGEYLGLTADSKGTFHALWTDGRTGSNQIWTAQFRVERSYKAASYRPEKRIDRIEANVSNQIEAYIDPFYDFPSAGNVELPIRLKNKSDHHIYGPIMIEVVPLYPGDNGPSGILNSINGKSGLGAVYDYSGSLGDFESLPPGGISEAVVWRFKAPVKRENVPRFKFKVTARIERPKAATETKTTLSAPLAPRK